MNYLRNRIAELESTLTARDEEIERLRANAIVDEDIASFGVSLHEAIRKLGPENALAALEALSEGRTVSCYVASDYSKPCTLWYVSSLVIRTLAGFDQRNTNCRTALTRAHGADGAAEE